MSFREIWELTNSLNYFLPGDALALIQNFFGTMKFGDLLWRQRVNQKAEKTQNITGLGLGEKPAFFKGVKDAIFVCVNAKDVCVFLPIQFGNRLI